MPEIEHKLRRTNPRSLENLRLGVKARNQGKVRRNCTLLPESIQWLEQWGNVSSAIDALVADTKNGELAMVDFKGGRGKETGYETGMYRIPLPIRPTVEKLALQFRLLWNEPGDPTGIKLISRVQEAISYPKQLADSNGQNWASGKQGVAGTPDGEQNPDFDNAHDNTLQLEIRELRARLKEVRNLSENQRVKIERLELSVNAHKLQMEKLQQFKEDSREEILELEKVNLNAASILNGILKKHRLYLEGNIGEKLKGQICQALKLLDA